MFLVLRQGDAIEALQATKTMTASSMPWRISGHEGFAEGRAVGRLGKMEGHKLKPTKTVT